MANTSVLDPFSTRPRETVKVNPLDQLGGSMEYVEEVLDSIIKGPESFGARESVKTPVPEVYKKAFSSGSFENFQTAKSPELLEKEATENQRRIIYSSLDEASREAQKVAQEPELADVEIQTEIDVMPEEVWNKKLHLSLDFDKKHTKGKPYYMTEYRRVRKEDREGVEIAHDQQTKAEIQDPTPFMGENEFHKGIERSGGGHWSNNLG